jgi:putative ABC transport system substrate-binding protein
MRRREFITLIGGAAATRPFAALAQQAAMPVIGYISAQLPEDGEPRAAVFRRGLQEVGYVVGQNVAIEYHWAEQQIDRLPAMAVPKAEIKLSLPFSQFDCKMPRPRPLRAR